MIGDEQKKVVDLPGDGDGYLDRPCEKRWYISWLGMWDEIYAWNQPQKYADHF